MCLFPSRLPRLVGFCRGPLFLSSLDPSVNSTSVFLLPPEEPHTSMPMLNKAEDSKRHLAPLKVSFLPDFPSPWPVLSIGVRRSHRLQSVPVLLAGAEGPEIPETSAASLTLRRTGVRIEQPAFAAKNLCSLWVALGEKLDHHLIGTPKLAPCSRSRQHVPKKKIREPPAQAPHPRSSC